MKRELSYREEMVQQLHIVRGETHKAEETLDSNTNVFAKLMLCVLKHESQLKKTPKKQLKQDLSHIFHYYLDQIV